MKKLIIILLLFTAFTSSAQVYQRDPAYGRSIDRYEVLKDLGIPTFCGTPTVNSTVTDKAKIAYDSCGHKFYIYDPSNATWGQVTGGGVIIEPGVDSITYHNNQLCQWVDGVSTCYFLNKFYDSSALNYNQTKIIHFNTGHPVDSVSFPANNLNLYWPLYGDNGDTSVHFKNDSLPLLTYAPGTDTSGTNAMDVPVKKWVLDRLTAGGGSVNDSVYVDIDTTADGKYFIFRRLNGQVDTIGIAGTDTSHLSDRIDANAANIAINTTAITGKQDAITLTTTGTSGAATLTGSTLNIPQYSGGGGSTISSNPKYINIIQSGQSNAWGGSGPTAYDTAANPRVLIWQHAQATPAWVVAHINQRPFRTAGYNSVDGTATRDDLNGSANSAFYLAKKIADENPNDTIRIILAIGDGRSISYWFNGTTRGQYTDSIIARGNASGIDHTDVFIWDQGESDGSTSEATYISRFDSIKATLRRQSWFSPTTPIVVSGLPQTAYGASPAQATYRDSTLKKMNYDNDQWTAYGNTDSLSIATDNIHWSASSLDTLGRTRYYTAWKTMPYRNGVGAAAGNDNEVQYNKAGALAASSTFRYSPTGFLTGSHTWIGAAINSMLTRTSNQDSTIFLDLTGVYNNAGWTSNQFVRMLKFGNTYWNSDSLWNISIGSGNSPLPASGSTFFVGQNAGNSSTVNNSVGIGVSALAGATGANSVAMGNGAGFGAGTSINAFGWGALQATGVTYTNALGYSAGKSSTASFCNYFGTSAGMNNKASYSNFIGNAVGNQALTGRNLHLIGTGITAPLINSVDMFDFGNAVYITHALYNTSTNPKSLHRGIAKMGINVPNPSAQLGISPNDSVAGSAQIKLRYTSLATTGGNGGVTNDTLYFADQGYPPFGDSSTITVSGVSPSGHNGNFLVINCTNNSVVFSNPGSFGAVTVNGTITQGKLLTTPEKGALEYAGTRPYFTGNDGVRGYIPLTFSGTAAPTTTPSVVGDHYVDTTNKKEYVATGTSSSSDWTILN